MNITVLSGSPKGTNSVTLQYVYFLQKKFPDHTFKIFHLSSQIRRIEKEDNVFQEIMEGVRTADGVLWAFPLYYLLVPSQYKRFIELLWERKATAVFKDKYTAVLSTSIHFFDHTAHHYMHAICDDLEMKYLGSFSALSVGGMKIFRDDLWGRLRFPFQADHPYYKKHRLYDFPHQRYKIRAINLLLILLTKIPSLRKEIYQKRIKSEMIRPFRKVLDRI